MLFSLLKHYLDTDTALKVSQSVYCFTTSISHGVENYFPRLWGTGISDAIFTSGASLIRWTSGHLLLSQLLTSLCTYCRTGSYSPPPLMVTGQPLLINWEIHPSTSAKTKISLISRIVSTETDPQAGGAYTPGTSHWSCTS